MRCGLTLGSESGFEDALVFVAIVRTAGKDGFKTVEWTEQEERSLLAIPSDLRRLPASPSRGFAIEKQCSGGKGELRNNSVCTSTPAD